MSAIKRDQRTVLNVESLTARIVPTTLIQLDSLPTGLVAAQIVDGNLVIQGTDHADVVRVTTVTVNNNPGIRVNWNGMLASFPAGDVTGRIEFYGQNGNDNFSYNGPKSVHAEGGTGDDIIRSGSGSDQLFGDEGNDYLSAGAGDDQLDGGSGSNELWGGSGNDRLVVPNSGSHNYLMGGAGNDTLIGGRYDYYAGGAGGDSFNRASQSPTVLRPLVDPPFTHSLPKRSGIADFNANEGDVLIPSLVNGRAGT